ncbi:hypothetical protein CJ030_MR1G005227 [Morella rubra]|uniref:CCHC-type domain-containing protein n=1 Tax=Morella rubra TaxID=262757 RepID=A0A6A1WQ14_9ROSI|nr:hypothetical protein CJ030_MR1G005227 [Morella rubra]
MAIDDGEGEDGGDYLLVGRLVSARPMNQAGIRTAIFRSWHFIPQLKVEEFDDTRFLFSFPSTFHRDRVLQQGPWNIKGCLLVLKEWILGDTLNVISFTSVAVWLQVHGLPLGSITKEVPMSARRRVGEVLEVDYRSSNRSWAATFVRVRVLLNIPCPLVLGFLMIREGKPPVWIQFKYERISSFCFNCGRLGHAADFCSLPPEHKEGMNQFGPLMKANGVEYRIFTRPEDLLSKMHSMKLHEEGNVNSKSCGETSSGGIGFGPLWGAGGPNPFKFTIPFTLIDEKDGLKSDLESPNILRPSSKRVHGFKRGSTDSIVDKGPSVVCGIKRRLPGWASETIAESALTGEENLPLAVWHLRAKKKRKDHAPIVLNTERGSESGPKPFRFEAFWARDNRSFRVVAAAWRRLCAGSPGHILCQKIKFTRERLREWNRVEFGPIQFRLKVLEASLDDLQRAGQCTLIKNLLCVMLLWISSVRKKSYGIVSHVSLGFPPLI